MAVPKRKQSKARTQRRRKSHKLSLAQSRPCPQCGAPQLSHRVCSSCGYYRGRQVLSVEAE